MSTACINSLPDHLLSTRPPLPHSITIPNNVHPIPSYTYHKHSSTPPSLSNPPHLSPITSTYRLFFAPFAAFTLGPFLGPPIAGPNKSSISLAPLMPVPGRLGGPAKLLLLAVLLIAGGAARLPALSACGNALPLISDVPENDRCGGADAELKDRDIAGGAPCGPMLGGREGPALGGGAADDGFGALSAPACLLIHRFCSGS